MRYSEYGLDDTKKSQDEGTAGRSNCLWCQSQVDNGFSMCFSNWVICKKCVETSNVETSENRWITDDCFKCNKKQVRCFTSSTVTVISICEDCLDWAKEVLDIQKMISPKNNNDMTFFTELAAVGNVDINLRIMQKNGKLTINVTPASMSASIQPIIITGTPEELDNGFFSEVFPEVQAIAGIASNIKDVKAEVEKKAAAAAAKPTATEKKETKPAAKKVEAPAKAPTAKQVAAPANDLFGDDDDEVVVAEGGESDDDQNEGDE